MTLDELRVKLELWKGSWPELTKTALQGGSNLVKEEIKRRWSGGVLQTQTGKLVNAVKTEVGLSPIHAKVYVDSKQQYKAQVFEQGRTITPGTGKRSKLRMKMTGKEGFLQIGPSRYGNYYWGRPRSVTITARPVFGPSLESKRAEVINLIKTTILEGYK
jgi:hypothetical protein